MVRPGGRAAFAEPLGTNLWSPLPATTSPIRARIRAGPTCLSATRTCALGGPLATAEHEEVQLLEMVERALGVRSLPGLRRVDGWSGALSRSPAVCRRLKMTK